MKRKKRKAISGQTTVLAPPREEEDAEMNEMMQWNHSYNHQSQSHMPLKGGGAVDTCEAHINNIFVFFIFTKLKMLLGLNNNNKQTMMKLQPSP